MESEDAPRFLLLLPAAPYPPTLDALRAAYGKTVKEVLKEVASHSSDATHAAVLEIALACEHLAKAQIQEARSALYDQTQSIVAGLYRLVVILAAEENINVEDADGVDVRVLLIAWSPSEAENTRSSIAYGPVIDFHTLAKSGRTWQFAFGDESPAGEAVVKAFLAAKRSSDDTFNAGNLPPVARSSKFEPISQNGRHYHVAVGGTFDHLHIGHKLLITMTLFAVDLPTGLGQASATIGITGDQLLVKKKHAELVESWADRQTAVARFVDALVDFRTPAATTSNHIRVRNDPGANGKSVDVGYATGFEVKCTEIQDPFGPTITEEQISALIISAETRSGGSAVNDKRAERGWRKLDILEVDVLDAFDVTTVSTPEIKEGFEGKLSSTAIREKLARQRAQKM